MLQVGGMNDLLVPHLALIVITSLNLVDSPSFDSSSLAKTNVAGVSDLVAGVGDYLKLARSTKTKALRGSTTTSGPVT